MPCWHAIVSARPNPSPNYRGRVVAASAAIAELGTEAHLQADIRTRCSGSWVTERRYSKTVHRAGYKVRRL